MSAVFEIPRDDETLAASAERAQARGCILIHNGRRIVIAPADALITMPGWWRVAGLAETRRTA